MIAEIEALPAAERAKVFACVGETMETDASWMPDSFKQAMADMETGRLVELEAKSLEGVAPLDRGEGFPEKKCLPNWNPSAGSDDRLMPEDGNRPEALDALRVMDCGGLPPLFGAVQRLECRLRPHRGRQPKAAAPRRFAAAVQDAGANPARQVEED